MYYHGSSYANWNWVIQSFTTVHFFFTTIHFHFLIFLCQINSGNKNDEATFTRQVLFDKLEYHDKFVP